MNLSQEYFDQQISKLSQRFDNLESRMSTKDDLSTLRSEMATKQALQPLATKQDITDAVDELARIVSDGFLGERRYRLPAIKALRGWRGDGQ